MGNVCRLGGTHSFPFPHSLSQARWRSVLGEAQILCQALGDSHGLLQGPVLHSAAALLTWPGTSPPPHNARSTGGLSAHTWMPARSWGLGPSQGGLERAGEEEHSTKRVRLVTAASKNLLHQTIGHCPWPVGPGFRRSAAVIASTTWWCGRVGTVLEGLECKPDSGAGRKRCLEGGMACHE